MCMCSSSLDPSHYLQSHFLISQRRVSESKTTNLQSLVFAFCSLHPRFTFPCIPRRRSAEHGDSLVRYDRNPLRVNSDFCFPALARLRNGSMALARVPRHSPACKQSS